MQFFSANHEERQDLLLCRILLAGLFLLLFAVFPRNAQTQEWVSTRVYGPFACWAEFDLTPADETLKELSRISEVLKERLDLPGSQEWIELYVFADEVQWRAFLEREYPNIPYRRALFLKKQNQHVQFFLYFSESFVRDLRRGGMHAFLRAVFPEVPIWLDEGLAEYFEVGVSDPEKPHRLFSDGLFHRTETIPKEVRASEWFPPIRERAERGELPPLSELESLRDMSEMTAERYAESWAWVTFLLHGPEPVRKILPAYISELHKRKTLPIFPFHPISRRLEKVYPDPTAELTQFFKRFPKS